MSKKANEKIGAIHLVAAGIDAQRKRGTPEYAEAKAFSDELVKIWKEQLWSKKHCPHCKHEL